MFAIFLKVCYIRAKFLENVRAFVCAGRKGAENEQAFIGKVANDFRFFEVRD